LDDVLGSSHIDIGKPDTSVMRLNETGDPEILWLDTLEDDPYWTNYVRGFYWGDVSTPILYKLPKTKAMLSTGASCI